MSRDVHHDTGEQQSKSPRISCACFHHVGIFCLNTSLKRLAAVCLSAAGLLCVASCGGGGGNGGGGDGGNGGGGGTGLGAVPSTLAFGSVLLDKSNSLPTLVTNSGNANVTVSAVTVTGAGFSASGISNGLILAPGQSATLTVTFAPTGGGAVGGASVSIASDVANSPTTVSLSGTGLHWAELSWDPSATGGVTYNVYRGTSSGGESNTPLNTTPITGTSYIDSTVTPGQNYFYEIKAVDSGGNSTPTNEGQGEVPAP